jgi:hypothetical protein
MRITLCGSAKFEEEFHEWNEKLTLLGTHVVYGLAVLPSWKGGQKDWYTEEQKLKLDTVHLMKILNSDAIVVLNRNNYIGESTRREIAWATSIGKPAFYIEGIPNASNLLRDQARNPLTGEPFGHPFDRGTGEDEE